MQNLRQKKLIVQEFTEELYRLSTRLGKIDEGYKVVVRYMNVIKYAIQYELILSRFKTVEEAYQLALKAEEKLSRKTSTSRGKSTAQSQKYDASRGHTSGARREEI